jgi:type I restriction enzyme S subunit
VSFVHGVDGVLDEHGNGLTAKADHWERVRLGDIADVVNGFPFPSAGFNKAVGEPVLRIRDITRGAIETYFQGSTAGAPRVEHDDLIVGMDGDFNSRLWSGGSAMMNQRVCKIVPDETLYSKRLLAYALPGYLKLINDHTSAITVKHLSSQTVAQLPLPLPPRAEQDRLVSRIDQLFSRIDEGERALERAQALVEHYRQSLLRAAVTGELTREWRKKNKDRLEPGEALLARILKARADTRRDAELAKMTAKGTVPFDDTWIQRDEQATTVAPADLPELPHGWAWAAAEAVCESVHSGTTPEQPLLQSTPANGVPFIKVYNLTFDGALDFSVDPTYVDAQHHGQKMKRSRTLPGDVLTNIVGPPLGKVSVVPSTHPEWNINQAIVAFRPLSGIRNDFLSIYLQSETAKAWLRATTKTTTSQVNLAVTTCRRLPIPVPGLLEQQHICEVVDRALSYANTMLAAARDAAARSIGLRQSTLKAAFSGRLVPQMQSDQPASLLLDRIAAQREGVQTSLKSGRRKKSKV